MEIFEKEKKTKIRIHGLIKQAFKKWVVLSKLIN